MYILTINLSNSGQVFLTCEASKHKSVMPTMRVPNRFYGIRDLAYFTARIWDFWGKGERDSGL